MSAIPLRLGWTKSDGPGTVGWNGVGVRESRSTPKATDHNM